MSLETIAFSINEALSYYGVEGYLSTEKLILAFMIDIFFMYYLLGSEKFWNFMNKYLPPDVILMFMWILLIDILIMKGAYTLILIFLALVGCFYIIFNNKKYKKYKEFLEHLIDKIL